ncbi:hypothetical protein C8R44DRAFT_801220 [Mycena epipterygia]|nr:hypothetical protein C8R44DRAFT_801220 [Mycena epipterygia]
MEGLLNIAQQFMAPPHDHEHTVNKASEENPEDSQYYEEASKHVANHTDQHRPPSDEETEQAKQAHHQIYREGNKDNLESMGADAVGGAVATEAIQKFLSGGGGDSKDLVAFAMTQASALLGGDAQPGFKAMVMKKAAMMAFKSQLGGGGGGMMGMLQKFM